MFLASTSSGYVPSQVMNTPSDRTTPTPIKNAANAICTSHLFLFTGFIALPTRDEQFPSAIVTEESKPSLTRSRETGHPGRRPFPSHPLHGYNSHEGNEARNAQRKC